MSAAPPSPQHVSTAAPGGSLTRQLGIWSAIAIVIGSMIGSGIFRVPSQTAAQVGTAGSMMLVWAAGGVVALCGALTLAEIAAMYPRAGGIYVYLNEAYGPLPAFLVGWLFLVIAPASIGADHQRERPKKIMKIGERETNKQKRKRIWG